MARLPTRKRTAPRRKPVRAGTPWWADLDDEQLLDVRLCDLGLAIAGSPLEPHLEALQDELGRRGIRFRPHFWVAERWFCPDGVPGFAVPFYLLHPRLVRLERRFMGEVEGGNARWLRRILRHETGHAVDNAHRLRRKLAYRRAFGSPAEEYPVAYSPRPSSRDHVLHLGHWYAQSHPCEDFAETFAVWLQPGSRWRTGYEGWPALDKLRCVDELMMQCGSAVAPVRTRRTEDGIATLKTTLREFYRAKCEHYRAEQSRRHDNELLRVFAPRGAIRARSPAAQLLRRLRPQLRRLLTRRNRLHPYVVSNVLRIVTRRVESLGLQLRHPERETRQRVVRMFDAILFRFLHRPGDTYYL
ncbi:MAG: hypothetical protein RL148_2782 [Planctomycetota bacterium]